MTMRKNELESFPFSQAEKGDVLCFDGGKWGHVVLFLMRMKIFDDYPTKFLTMNEIFLFKFLVLYK